jgi:hypothetical protein
MFRYIYISGGEKNCAFRPMANFAAKRAHAELKVLLNLISIGSAYTAPAAENAKKNKAYTLDIGFYT